VPYSEGGLAGHFISAARAKGSLNVVYCDFIAEVPHERVGVRKCFKLFQPLVGISSCDPSWANRLAACLVILSRTRAGVFMTCG
jgi:hypothetical protein